MRRCGCSIACLLGPDLAQLDVNTKLPIAARRCHEQFEKLFVLRYAEEFGAGLVLPKNKTRLHLDYRPASPSLRGCASRLGSSFDLPDVTVLTSPLKRLRDLGERCAAELSGYSRKSAAGKVDSNTLEGLSELPFHFMAGSLSTQDSQSSQNGACVRPAPGGSP